MKMYIVSYSKYAYEDRETFHVFVTGDEKKAIEYVNKFNGILDKWTNYYNQFTWNYSLKEEYKKYYYRWITLKDFNEAYYDEVEFR